ncbi:PAS domain S-box protein [Nostoc sp. UHCC 0702]|nr:PAS domain S-box protein [Nostoc sp. UHCC 0702]
MNIEKFLRRTEILNKRLTDLSQTANILPWIPRDLLPQAFQEIQTNLRNLNLAVDELYQQNEQLIETQSLLASERQHYRDLFESAPEAYLVSNAKGIIFEANLAAARLLNFSKHFMVGKALINFVPLEERQHLRSFLNQLSESDKDRELIVRLQQRDGESFNANLTVAVVRNQQGNIISLRWIMRKIVEAKQAELSLVNNDSDLIQNRYLHKYTKGENITLNPLEILYVCRGLVKLSSFCETGEEVLVGLAKGGMVFGSSLTFQNNYQATALCDVELVSINVGEIAASLTLSYTLLPKIKQRLQQTEAFLVICGRRRVKDRLHHLLQLLKQEVGESMSDGTRLSVRFTHEDIASACCTTRVTITRLMGKLEKQGIISFDSKNYIILKDF